MWDSVRKTDEHMGRGERKRGKETARDSNDGDQTEGCWGGLGGGWARRRALAEMINGCHREVRSHQILLLEPTLHGMFTN